MAGRRANGEGSIYRRKDGRYEAAAYFLTISGRRKRLRVYGRTRAEVRSKLIEAQAQAEKGIPLPDRSWKLDEYLTYWLKETIAPSVRPTTFLLYESIVRLYLKPGLGHQPLVRLSVPTTQHFLNQQLAGGKSLRRVQTMREVLRAALNQACREEVLFRNVAALAKLPRRSVSRGLADGDERAGIEPWTTEECQIFLEAIRDDPQRPAYLLAMLYGLRRGEVLGLRWCDVKVDKGELWTRQQLQRIGSQLVTAPLKTEASCRNLPLLGSVADSLLALRPPEARDTDLIFCTPGGRPFDPYQLSRRFRRLCAQHGLRRIRLHDLRHTQTTLLEALGVSAKTRQLVLGHSRESTTQQIYTHPFMASARAGLEQLAQALLLRDVDGNRCRQIWPSNNKMVRYAQRIVSGDPTESRTPVARMKSRLSLVSNDPITEVMLVLRTRTKQWFVGRVAVKFSRQVLPTQPVYSLRKLWSFTSAWLDNEEPTCVA